MTWVETPADAEAMDHILASHALNPEALQSMVNGNPRRPGTSLPLRCPIAAFCFAPLSSASSLPAW
jgi:hypothetical protein